VYNVLRCLKGYGNKTIPRIYNNIEKADWIKIFEREYETRVQQNNLLKIMYPSTNTYKSATTPTPVYSGTNLMNAEAPKLHEEIKTRNEVIKNLNAYIDLLTKGLDKAIEINGEYRGFIKAVSSYSSGLIRQKAVSLMEKYA